ncbi:kinase-like domain-containing protein [Dichotomocladium elegans]|nr:kinase-like domain-containing protein [Dichotomocladium elegans]
MDSGTIAVTLSDGMQKPHPELDQPSHQRQSVGSDQSYQANKVVAGTMDSEKSPSNPTMTTDVDDPSHPLFHHRRTVTDFEYGPVLGEGSYSTVLVGKDKKTGKHYAVKKLDKRHIVKNNKVKYVMIERDALSKMNHPGIIRLYWTFKDSRSLYYVIDLARNGELYTYIRRLAPFDLDTTRFYASEILLAIEHIHSRNVIHRDIKPENILLDDRMHIKIADFGSAKILQPDVATADNETSESTSHSRSFVGTAEYVSPELLRDEPTLREADFWALGCVIYQMIAGRSPFKAATDYLIFQKVKNLDYSFPDGFPGVAKDLVQKLLQLEPEKRLGSAATGGIEALKSHPFFAGTDWDTIWESQAPPLKERLDAKLRRTRATAEEIPDNDDVWFGDGDEAIGGTGVNNPFMDEPSHRIINEEEDDDDDDDDNGVVAPHRRVPYDSAQLSPLTAVKPTRQQEADNALSSECHPETTTVVIADDTTTTNSSNITGEADGRGHTRTPSSQSSMVKTLGEQARPPEAPYLLPNESIVKAGRVTRRRGIFSKQRFLVLTDKPRLLYFDEGQGKGGEGGRLRCEIPWSSQMLSELKTKSTFYIHTPQKSYTFEDTKSQAQEWVNTINSMLVDSFGVAA